jgi:hypothetical protein
MIPVRGVAGTSVVRAIEGERGLRLHAEGEAGDCHPRRPDRLSLAEQARADRASASRDAKPSWI